MLKKLMSHLREYRIYAILTPIFLIVEVATEVLIPMLMSQILDTGIPQQDASYVVRHGIIMIILALIGIASGVIGARVSALAGTGLGKNLRKDTFGKIQTFSFANVDKFSTASLLTRLTTDVSNTQNAFITGLRTLARSPIMLVSALFMSLRINKSLTLTFLLAIPAIAIVFFFVARAAFPAFRDMLEQFDGLNAIVQENLTGMRVVKAFVREEHEEEKFQSVADNVLRAQRRAEHILVLAMPVIRLIMYACLIMIFWIGGRMAVYGDMGVGQFLSLFTYVMQILWSLIMIAVVFVQIVVSRASMVRVVQVLDERVSIVDGDDCVQQMKDGSVEFDGVGFRYTGPGDHMVLEDITLSIESGETVGIVGSTGSAKSTLVQLIPRLYDVTSGNVRVGGVDVRDYQVEYLRDQVAMVLQKNTLFSGSIRENLLWGNENATDEEIIQAAKIASAHDFVMSFPEGYDTWLEQGGVNLSGGQKQRLTIARALLKNPKVIILDDSTSAVDTTTDASIRRALREQLSETTSIIIAQRIASVSDADKIVVMDQGRINGVGTHDELLKSNQIYREIYESQERGVAS